MARDSAHHGGGGKKAKWGHSRDKQGWHSHEHVDGDRGGAWRSGSKEWSGGGSGWKDDQWSKSDSKTWSKGDASWSKSWSSEWNAEEEDMDEDRPEGDFEPRGKRVVKLIARPSAEGSPKLSPGRRREEPRRRDADFSGSEEDYEQDGERSEEQPPPYRQRSRSPRRSAPSPGPMDDYHETRELPPSPAPGSPVSVGSSVMRDNLKAAMDRGGPVEDDESASEEPFALPVEVHDDKSVPGPVRAGTVYKSNELHERRRKDAAEAAKMKATAAKSAPAPPSSFLKEVSLTPVGSPGRDKPVALLTPAPGASSSRDAAPRNPVRLREKPGLGASTPTRDSRQPDSRVEDDDFEAPPPGDWGISWQDLSEAMKKEFKDKVMDQLRVLGMVNDVELIADLIFVLVGDPTKSREDMATELDFMGDDVGLFVTWVEACKEGVLTRHQSQASRVQLTANPSSEPSSHVATTTPSRPAAAKSAAAPPGGASTGVAKSRRRSRPAKDKKKAFVVVTKKVCLQPNAANADDEGGVQAAVPLAKSKSRSGSSGSSSSRSQTAAAEAAGEPSAEEKKVTLLAQMTQKLQVILTKLQDKTLDDTSREKYQALCQTIQASMNKMTGISLPADEEEEEWGGGYGDGSDAVEYW